MELRVLNYFLATAQELNMTKAAQKLLISQPALSRQIADLETELGVKLFTRNSRHLTLTPAGQYLQAQAKEIIELADKTKANLQDTPIIGGNLTIAAGESLAMQVVLDVISSILNDYPAVKIKLESGDFQYASQRLDTGTVDFAVILGDIALDNYTRLKLPINSAWGLVVHKDDPLAQKQVISPTDLVGRKVINAKQADNRHYFDSWFGNYLDQINFIGTYNLAFNASMLVKNHTAVMLTFADLIHDNQLKFIPLDIARQEPATLIWNAESRMSPVAQLFLQRIKEKLAVH